MFRPRHSSKSRDVRTLSKYFTRKNRNRIVWKWLCKLWWWSIVLRILGISCCFWQERRIEDTCRKLKLEVDDLVNQDPNSVGPLVCIPLQVYSSTSPATATDIWSSPPLLPAHTPELRQGVMLFKLCLWILLFFDHRWDSLCCRSWFLQAEGLQSSYLGGDFNCQPHIHIEGICAATSR